MLLAAAVLGASCTGDRPSGPGSAGSPTQTAPPLERCDVLPVAPPEGFILTRSRDIGYRDHVGIREEYRDQDGRLLVYLLGVAGEHGEGATIEEEVELAWGEPATLFGSEGTDAWSVVWSEDPPCNQVAVVGNGFDRERFLSAMRDAGILSGVA